MTNTYDVILIGSGIGAMTVAVELAQQKGWRCLILEQNFNLGGMTHEFVRQRRFHFDVGLHYVGEMQPGAFPRKLMDYVTGGTVDWTAMAEPFERFVYPDFTFDVPSDPNKYLAKLQDTFPGEAGALRGYFRDIKRTFRAMSLEQFREAMPSILRPAASLMAQALSSARRHTAQSYLDAHFRDPRLKALLASQWGDFGVTPSKAAFAIHALIVNHYLNGAFFPVGGAAKIAEGALSQVRHMGGDAIPGMLVESLLLSKAGKVIGVKARNSLRNRDAESFFAPVVISSVGAANTYMKLLPQSARPPFMNKLKDLEPSLSAVSLFLGFRESPEKFGYKGGNYWVFGSYNHEQVLEGEPGERFYYLSFPSLKDPTRNAHTAEIMSFINPAQFGAWHDSQWRLRGKDYEDMKERIAQSLLKRLRDHHPALADLVEFYEVATPLTYEYFQQSPNGAFYQLPFLPDRPDWPFARCRTPVEGLYLTGADTFSPGIVGAMMGGLKCLAIVLGGGGFLQLMGRINRPRTS